MKVFAPKHLRGEDLRGLLAELCATPADACKYLQVPERTFRRWLTENSAPYSALAALWLESPAGRHTTALDVGNEAVLYRGLSKSTAQALEKETARLGRLCAIADTGAANDPFLTGPLGSWCPVPLLVDKVPQIRQLADDVGRQDGRPDRQQGLIDDGRWLG